MQASSTYVCWVEVILLQYEAKITVVRLKNVIFKPQPFIFPKGEPGQPGPQGPPGLKGSKGTAGEKFGQTLNNYRTQCCKWYKTSVYKL